MKARLMAGLVAVTFWSGSAVAQDTQHGSTTTITTQTTQSTAGTPQPAPSSATGGSGATADRPVTPEAAPAPSTTTTTTQTQAFTSTEADKEAYERKRDADMRGLTVTLGGGVEGYTQALAPAISPGPSVAVNANIRPSKVLGLELGYSGAVNEIKQEDNVSGADLVRNGGQAAVTLGLNAAAVQPYVLGGIGVSRYNVRDEGSERFRDDTVGNVPVGAGLRTHLGNFTADARVGYNFLFDQQFARNVPTSDVSTDDVEFSKTGRYNATLNFGTTF
jgi:Outer membrane protein beta-barrel domain